MTNRIQSGQTNQAHPVLTGYYPIFVQGNTPSLYPQLPRVVRVHCNCNYPQADQSAARNLEKTNHKSACGLVAVTMHPNYPG